MDLTIGKAKVVCEGRGRGHGLNSSSIGLDRGEVFFFPHIEVSGVYKRKFRGPSAVGELIIIVGSLEIYPGGFYGAECIVGPVILKCISAAFFIKGLGKCFIVLENVQVSNVIVKSCQAVVDVLPPS
jgi:hypothetical protein